MFVSSIKFVENHHGNRKKISVLGQESNPDTWRLAKMNLAIRGISCNLGRTAASTFSEDQHRYEKVDFIMANPPFNLNLAKEKDFLDKDDPRWEGYVTPPDSNANYAWILHMLDKLDETNGIAGFLLANGALNAMDTEVKIREQIIKNDKVEAIIVLPRNMFYSTDISVTLWILNNNKKERDRNGRHIRNHEGETLFIDLRRWDNNIQELRKTDKERKKKVILTDEQISKVKEIFQNWQTGNGYEDVPELCKSVNLATMKQHGYSLAPSEYIEFIDHDLEIDYGKEMHRIQAEMKEVIKTEKESQAMLVDAFNGIGYDISGGGGNG
jgi:type I restriction enzyme M protein